MTEKQLVSDILEADAGSRESVARAISSVQVAAGGLVDWFDDHETAAAHGVPREFFDLCAVLARMEVKL